MGKHVRHLGDAPGLRPTAMALLHEPLEFIHADHLREREICALIDKIVGQGPGPAHDINAVIMFLTNELPMHLRDEEEDLFPLLRRRCTPDDQIGKVIARLQRDHHHANEDTLQIIALLQGLMDQPHVLTQADKNALTAYAGHSRRHLILENAIVLPFARLRLTEMDLETLRIRMCQRRNVDPSRKTMM